MKSQYYDLEKYISRERSQGNVCFGNKEVTSWISRGVERNKSHLDTRHHVSWIEFKEHTGWCEQISSFFHPHHLMNQKDKVLGLQPEKKTSLVPSRNIIFIFYEGFLITPPQHTLYTTRYKPQAAMPAADLLHFPEWLSSTGRNMCGVVPYLWDCALCRANTRLMWHPGIPKLHVSLGTKNLVVWGSLV